VGGNAFVQTGAGVVVGVPVFLALVVALRVPTVEAVLGRRDATSGAR
jgi:hypothetical protein